MWGATADASCASQEELLLGMVKLDTFPLAPGATSHGSFWV